MIKKIVSLAFAVLMTASAALHAQNNVQGYVNTVLKTDPLLKNAAVALLVEDGRGQTVAQWNPDLPLLSASTMKTITTGVALDVLGPDFRFETRIAQAGDVDADGILHGDIYIIGGGDPTLGSHNAIAFPADLVFADWTAALRNAGITAIDGRIIGDKEVFSCGIVQSNWCWDDLGAEYGSGPCGLSFAENLSYYSVTPGLFENDPVAIAPVEAVFSEMNLINDAVTGAPKSGNHIWYYSSDLSPVGRFTGTYAADRATDTIAVSNKFPALTCAEAFARYLAGEGIYAGGKATGQRCPEAESDSAALDSAASSLCDVSDGSGSITVAPAGIPIQAALGAAPDTAILLTTTYSPKLQDICRETNTQSNNFFAETLFMMLSLHLTGEASYSKAAKAVEQYIADAKCNTTGLRQDDGSGLSRFNFVSPRFFCNFYRMMQKSNIFAEYLATLPTPGCDGTLRNILRDEPGQLRSRIHCKSGSMTAVRCYAGYVETAGGDMLRFAIMVNNFDCPNSKIQPKVEEFLKQLALYER